jgi:RimJ/RimL family protein N-acetyltransferase
MSIELEDATVRCITPDDGDALVEFHEGLSLEATWFRFLGCHPHLSEAEVEHLTNVDGVYRAALVIEHDGKIVAVGRYDGEKGSDQADVAFVVADDYRRRGYASWLLDLLAVKAAYNDITRFRADVLSENYAMRRVFYASGYKVHAVYADYGVTHFWFDTEKGGDGANMADRSGTL